MSAFQGLVVSDAPRAAYVHVPFCRHRCGYCDFPLITGRDELIADYLRALEIELATLGHPREVETLFFGGGTPTHLSADELRQMFQLVSRWLPCVAGAEITVEANPNDLDGPRVDALIESGVNRVSLGVQSLDTAALLTLERDHTADSVSAVVNRLKTAGLDNLSLDLIFGVPGQTPAEWRETLSRVTSLNVSHVSAYGLTYEKGTAFWNRRREGGLQPIDEELERQMYSDAMSILPDTGLQQYEISNYARLGNECRHNLVYWRGESYFAFGPGAARYVDGVRSMNYRSVTGWLKRVLAGESAVAESERLDAEGRARELVMLGLRQTAGIDAMAFRERTGFDVETLGGGAFDRLIENRLLERSDGRIRLTREGRFLADTVTAEFI